MVAPRSRGSFFADFREYLIAGPWLIFVSPGQVHRRNQKPRIIEPLSRTLALELALASARRRYRDGLCHSAGRTHGGSLAGARALPASSARGWHPPALRAYLRQRADAAMG